MKKNSPLFAQMISDFQAGGITRDELAAKYGLAKTTLAVYLSRAGVTAGKKELSGTAAMKKAAANADPDKVAAEDAAIARVLAGESTAYAEAQADRRLNLSTLTMKVRKARTARGDAVKAGRGRPFSVNLDPHTLQAAVERLRQAREALRVAQEQVEQAEKNLDLALTAVS